MRLSSQLAVFIILLIVILFVGTFWSNVQSSRVYLAEQLASHAQDGATSLGLSTTSHMMNDDRATVTSMVDALFDGGDYALVRVEDLGGEPWVERKQGLSIVDVPPWFVDWVKLETPQGQADVMQGWRQAGRVLVRSHPGYAYQQLWSNARKTLIWYGLGAAVAALLGVLMLRWLLRPLREVERQAAAICNREFPQPLATPFAIEFRSVVQAMNRLSAKVQHMLGDAERLILKLRKQANSDPVTGLVNRRLMNDVLQNRIEDPAGFAGGLLLIELRDFKSYNQRFGYPAGDRLLKACAGLLLEQTGGPGGFVVARMSGANFAVLTEGQELLQFDRLGKSLSSALGALASRQELDSADVGHVGGAYFRNHTTRQLLSEADGALRQAQSTGANAFVLALPREAQGVDRSRSAWRALIEQHLDDGELLLAWQSVHAADGSVMHREAFLRMPDPEDRNRLLAAGGFLPMAEANGLAPRLDRFVLERVLERLVRAPLPLALNLAPVSLLDLSLLEWLKTRLEGRGALAAGLILEVSEYGASAYTQQLQNWIKTLRPLGVRFALDHFGLGFGSLGYLRSLSVDILKIDGAFVQDIDTNPDNQFLMEAIRGLAHSLDMQVVAEAVETEPLWNALVEAGVDGGQGYWLGKPEIEV